MAVTTLINDEKQQCNTFSIPPPTEPLERGQTSSTSSSCAADVKSSSDSNCSTPLQFQKLFFPLHWSHRWKACTRHSQLQLGFDAFKSVTLCCDIRQEPGLKLWQFASCVSNGKWKTTAVFTVQFLQPFLTLNKFPHYRKQQWKKGETSTETFLWRTRFMKLLIFPVLSGTI